MIYGRPVGGAGGDKVTLPVYTGDCEIKILGANKGYINLYGDGMLVFPAGGRPDTIDVCAIGGGGSSGRSYFSTGSTDYGNPSYSKQVGGGGAGAFLSKLLAHPYSGDEIAVVIGQGGKNGSDGGTTTFGTILSAAGGGAGNEKNGGNGGTGGAAGAFGSKVNASVFLIMTAGSSNGANGNASTQSNGTSGSAGTGDGLPKLDLWGEMQCGSGGAGAGSGSGTYGVGGSSPDYNGNAQGYGSGSNGIVVVRWGNWSEEDAAMEAMQG